MTLLLSKKGDTTILPPLHPDPVEVGGVEVGRD
jgi:hypothetical protein